MHRPKLTITPSASSESQRPPSSASSARPSSSSSFRPPSSASLRPPSSASHRPPSAQSTHRPPSSASVRSASRLSQRPVSRLSQRPATRQSTRLLPSIQTLVTQVSGISAENDEEEFRAVVESVSRSLDYKAKAAPSSNLDDIEKQFKGLVRKARINSEDAWASALQTSYTKLKTHMQQASTDLDEEIKSADQSTLRQAENYLESIRNPPPKPPTLTWKEILDEEPFEGQHWEGVYGLPPGSTVEGWETRSLDSTPPLSPLDSGDRSDLDVSISSVESLEPEEEQPLPNIYSVHPTRPSESSYAYRQEVEDLQAKQYWRTEWKPDFPISTTFDIGNASSFGPAITRALSLNASALQSPGRERYIYEHDAVREVLMALQGRQNLMLRWTHRSGTVFLFEPIANAPRLSHLSLTAQNSILETFADTATVLEHLRKYTFRILSKAIHTNDSPDRHSLSSGRQNYPNLTLQAYCDAVDSQIRQFDSWCAAREQDIGLAKAGAGAPLVVSLLSLQKQLRDTFARTFEVLLDVTRRVTRQIARTQDTETEIWMLAELPVRTTPSGITTLLLDTLLSSVQEHITMDDIITSDTLMRVFTLAA
ncbi:hypothetical protein DENSPDRAFT_846943 [Dentipellis sp. KUC8613]|nr:hypothetical protein DENSPDRAFT_846943 [Dentipellis sp. KUC8613]